MKTILISHFAILLFIIPGMSWAQVITITGYVNDGTNGKALENVSIFEKNSGIGTITNQNGFYKLILQQGDIDLSISDDGFKTLLKQIQIKSDTTLVLKLQPELNAKQRQKKADQVHAGVKSNKKNESQKGFKLF